MNYFKKYISIPNILFFVIFFLGLTIRLQPVFAKTFAFTYDVGRDMLNVSQIVYAHKIPLIGPTTGLPGLFYGPWWYYFITPAFFLSGGNPQAVAFFMVIVGMATILCAYALGVYVEGKLLGAFLAGLIAFSSVTISLSVQIWNPNISQLFVVLVLFLLVRLKKNGISLLSYTFLGIFLGLTIDSEVVFGLLFSIGIILASILLLRKEFTKKGILFFLLGILIIFSPRIFFEVKHNFVMTTHILQLAKNSSSNVQPFSFFSLLMQRFSMFWDTFNWAFGQMIPLSIISLVVIAMQTTLFVRHHEQSLASFIVKVVGIISGVFFIGLLFFTHDVFSHYLVALPVYFLLVFGICIYFLLKNYGNKLLISAIVIFLGVFVNPFSVYAQFFGKPWVGDPSVYRNQLKAIDYVYQNAHGKEFAYETYTPARIDYPYQYLFAWYGKNTFHYQPTKTANKLFVIFETDDNNVGAWYWKVQREKTSRMTDRVVLPGGIIVQTREKI